MKRLIALIAAIGLVIGMLAIASEIPAEATPDGTSIVDHSATVTHNVPANESYNICLFLRPNSPDWGIHHWRSLHYGTADVVQCEFYSWLLDEFACGMYVWNVPEPWFSFYPPEGIHPFCW